MLIDMQKKLYTFYCADCDNAWLELSDITYPVSKCDYCNKEESADECVEDL
jgi:hypothetical protein